MFHVQKHKHQIGKKHPVNHEDCELKLLSFYTILHPWMETLLEKEGCGVICSNVEGNARKNFCSAGNDLKEKASKRFIRQKNYD